MRELKTSTRHPDGSAHRTTADARPRRPRRCRSPIKEREDDQSTTETMGDSFSSIGSSVANANPCAGNQQSSTDHIKTDRWAPNASWSSTSQRSDSPIQPPQKTSEKLSKRHVKGNEASRVNADYGYEDIGPQKSPPHIKTMTSRRASAIGRIEDGQATQISSGSSCLQMQVSPRRPCSRRCSIGALPSILDKPSTKAGPQASFCGPRGRRSSMGACSIPPSILGDPSVTFGNIDQRSTPSRCDTTSSVMGPRYSIPYI